MLGDFVADDDELQVVELPFLAQFAFERGKRLDDAHYIFVRADAPGVEQKRRVHLIALGDEFALGIAGVAQAEAVVDGVVDDLDLLRRHMEQAHRVSLGKIRDREDARRAMQHALGELEMHVALHADWLFTRYMWSSRSCTVTT